MRKIVLGVLFLMGVVPLSSFAKGLWSYWTGTAVLMGVGYPGPEFFNLDRATRAPWETSGCIVTGIELVTHVPNNLAVALMAALFGPMRGAYDGPYPSRDELEKAFVSRGVPRTTVSGREVSVHACDVAIPEGATPTTPCFVVEDRLLVWASGGFAHLKDSTSGVEFARYQFRGRAEVESEPTGAAIAIDGEPLGAAPVHAGGLFPGRHEVVAALPDHDAVQQQIEVGAGWSVSQVRISLKAAGPETGIASIRSRPGGARVFVDGVEVGETPLEAYRLRVGIRYVEIQTEGFSRWSGVLSVREGEETRVDVRLSPLH